MTAGLDADVVGQGIAPTAPPPWWRQWPALRHVARTRVSAMFAYRRTMLLFLAVSVIQIFMLKKVWSALYATRPDALGMSLHDLVVYLTLANLITWSFPTHTLTQYVRERIREGSVVFDLVRPLGFAPQMVAQLVGSLAGAILIICLALPVVAVAGSLALPAGPAAGAMFVLSLALGYAIAGLLTLALSMVAFWTLEMDGITTLYALISSFLSGALVPLSAFPDTLRTIVQWLPFQATTYVPTSIYVGALDGAAAWRSIGVQVIWVAVLGLLTAGVWQRAMRRVVVQGG